MKILLLFATIILISGCSTQSNSFSTSFGTMMDNIIPDNWAFTKEWSPSHWKGQDFQPSIDPNAPVKRQSLDQSRSMFANSQGITPNEFIENLKQARIIKRVYNPEFGFFWDRHVGDEVVVELDHNFYTLSYADQTVIADMISRSYQKRHYSLTDARTKKEVGQITPEGLYLF